MNIKTIITIMPAFMLAACADGNYRPTHLDDSFGQSQKHMVAAQIANPQAAANPSADSPRKMDGYAGVNTMRSYRDAFGLYSQPQGLTINIGSGSGSSGSSSGSGGR